MNDKYLVIDTGDGCRIGPYIEGTPAPVDGEFLIVNGDDLPATMPDYWSIDNGVLISDDKPARIEELRKQRDASLGAVTVTVGSSEVWADPLSERNVSGRIRQMEADGQADCEWIQGDEIFVLTLAELKTVLEEGTKKCAAIYDDYIAAVKAL